MSVEQDTDRGQLIIAGGVIVAVLLIAVVIILNGVLVTENLSTRPLSGEVSRSQAIITSTHANVGELVDRHNQKQYEEIKAEAEVRKDVDNLSRSLTRQQFHSHGVVVSSSVQDTHQAWMIEQEESAEFTAAYGDEGDEQLNWSAGVFTGVRDITISADSLAETTPSEREDAFHLELWGDDGIWTLYMYENANTGDIVVESESGDGDNIIDEQCTVSGATPVTVQTAPFRVNGELCDIVTGTSIGDGPYTVYMSNGDEIQGTYHFVGGREGTAVLYDYDSRDNVRNTLKGTDSVTTDPVAYDAVYGVKMHSSYEGNAMNTTNTVWIAPNTSTPMRTILPQLGDNR